MTQQLINPNRPNVTVIPQSYASDMTTIAYVADIVQMTGMNKSEIHRIALRDLWQKLTAIQDSVEEAKEYDPIKE